MDKKHPCHSEYKLAAGISFLDGLNLLLVVLCAVVAIVPSVIAFASGVEIWNCVMLFALCLGIVAVISPLVAIPIFIGARRALTKVRSVRLTQRGITVQTMLTRRELRWEDIEIPYPVSETKLRVAVRYQRPVVLTNEIKDFNQLAKELSTNIRQQLKSRETSD